MSKIRNYATHRHTAFEVEDVAGWQEHLDQQGYAVLQNVLPEERRLDLLEIFWQDWQSVSPRFIRTDARTWTDDNSPMTFGKGMAVMLGFGQSNLMWGLRTEPRIQQIFRSIHDTDELCTSLDGFSVFFSTGQQSKSWLHIDQNPTNPLYCVQGAYNFFAVDENDAGLVVVPRSHLQHFATTKTGDWVMLDDPALEEAAVKLLIPQNGFVLWNSRTVHANTGMFRSPKRGRRQDEQESVVVRSDRATPPALNRLTCYITFLPSAIRPEIVVQEKEEAYRGAHTTSHWANRCENKKVPAYLRDIYASKGYHPIVPLLTAEGKVPRERLDLF
eukprot:TRINITY_DN2658_c0_g3_i1.p1 TRINITY_DN2658_c0_g3~~TRINITY_DN2658_c0_g3_i1.p1  ORF type:complete len:330 (-),score=65.29 TRINITY_DN2658_c0_g3_i1:230-1219(-)